MTIDLHATGPDTAECHDDMVQFVYCQTGAAGLLAHARALLDAAPKELAESFEQAVRTSGLTS